MPCGSTPADVWLDTVLLFNTDEIGQYSLYGVNLASVIDEQTDTYNISLPELQWAVHAGRYYMDRYRNYD